MLDKKQKALIDAIESLALCYSPNAKPIPERSYSFWFDACQNSRLPDIKEAIENWSQTQSMMMTPADLRKALMTIRRNRSEKEQKQSEVNGQQISDEVRQELQKAMQRAYRSNPTSNDWARRLRIKEAYGFVQTEFQRLSWRRAMNLPDDYNFDEYGEVFPIDNMPDQRRSFYHDCQALFIAEYVSIHGLELVYDKELATKKYPTQPFRYDGAGKPVFAKEAA